MKQFRQFAKKITIGCICCTLLMPTNAMANNTNVKVDNTTIIYDTVKTTAPSKKKVVKITDSIRISKKQGKLKITLYGKAKDGSTVWKFSSPYVSGSELDIHQYFINKNTIYLFSDKLYALNKSTGKIKWTYDQFLGGVSTAFDSKGNMYYTGYYEDNLYCISPSGKLKFKTPLPQDYYWPYKIKLSSGKLRVYVCGGQAEEYSSCFLTYTTSGKYLKVYKK